MADQVGGEDLSKMKVVDLKKALKERGLTSTGTKSELLERLSESMLKPDAVTEELVDLQEPQSQVQETPDKTETVLTADSAAVSESPKETEESPSKVETEQSLTAAERLQKRADRFGVTSTDSKKQARAERFGIVSEDSKKQARAERFGVVSSPTGNSKLSTAGQGADVDMLKKRAERFGQVVSSTLTKVDELERIRKRKQRFGGEEALSSPKTTKITYNSTTDSTTNSAVEELKRKRAERFGLS